MKRWQPSCQRGGGLWRSGLAILSLSLALSACDRPSEPLPGTAPISTKVTVADVKRLYERIDPDHPGRGVTDYPGNTVDDVPKSYAMVLMADIERKRHADLVGLPELGSIAGYWLLDHADENKDGVIGWGVPIAWDAYGDGSENPAHTEYSISTAIVIDALLNWREAGAGAPESRILEVVEHAARPYLDERVLTPSGLLPYSLRESDRRYDTFNSAAYLAGQFQRLSTLTADSKLRDQLKDVADKTIASLVKNHKLSPETGAWYWDYSIQELSANDLPHASYIVEGLRTYAAHEGRLANQVDIDRTLDHLLEFSGAGSFTVRAWPRFRVEITLPARSYDLGMAMQVACTSERLASIRGALADALPLYVTPEGAYLKYPLSSGQPWLVVGEYEAYLYRGLATCLNANSSQQQIRSKSKERLQIDSTNHAKAVSLLSMGSRPDEVVVPFVSLTTPHRDIEVLYSPTQARSRVRLSPSDWLTLPAKGVPLGVLDDEAGVKGVFMRTMPDDRLLLLSIDSNEVKAVLQVRHDPARNPIFRAATLHEKIVYLVYYDNPTQANYLQTFSKIAGAYVPIGDPRKLESLEDPAGGTYEMIPRLDFVAYGSNLWLVGGTLSIDVLEKGQLKTHRLASCSRTIEVVATPLGPVALCAAKDSSGGAYVLASSSDGTSLPNVDASQGLPWNLRLEDGSIKLSYAKKSGELAALIRRDLSRGQQGGWLEFGINNTEGRVPWSQIYYLNGFLDIIYLALRDEKAFAVFESLLADVRLRLDLELSVLDAHWRAGRYRTRAFTVDRSEALFSVQTSRLLLLMDRYRSEVPGPATMRSHEDIKRSVIRLDGHIEQLSRTGESLKWLPQGKAHLRWPYGSKFYFDGVGVPYNHQNEWAYAMTRVQGILGAPADVINHFIGQMAPGGVLPYDGRWKYWWGRAYDGWTEADNISLNKPTYVGDKSEAWISFRSIDTMALIAASEHLDIPVRERLIASATNLVREGKVYPFASYELMRQSHYVLPERRVALAYGRTSAPWELQSAVWAITALAHEEKR